MEIWNFWPMFENLALAHSKAWRLLALRFDEDAWLIRDLEDASLSLEKT